jgi:hypothetical protein
MRIIAGLTTRISMLGKRVGLFLMKGIKLFACLEREDSVRSTKLLIYMS